jgi:hypothetical protein
MEGGCTEEQYFLGKNFDDATVKKSNFFTQPQISINNKYGHP